MFRQKFYYYSRGGEVFFYEDGNAFSVLMKQYIGDGTFHCKVFTTPDYEVAVDKYKGYMEILNGDTPARVCVSNPNRRRKCSAENCPKKLGGSAFWQLFRDSCLYRTK